MSALDVVWRPASTVELLQLNKMNIEYCAMCGALGPEFQANRRLAHVRFAFTLGKFSFLTFSHFTSHRQVVFSRLHSEYESVVEISDIIFSVLHLHEVSESKPCEQAKPFSPAVAF